jgi:hypothetical protein
MPGIVRRCRTRRSSTTARARPCSASSISVARPSSSRSVRSTRPRSSAGSSTVASHARPRTLELVISQLLVLRVARSRGRAFAGWRSWFRPLEPHHSPRGAGTSSAPARGTCPRRGGSRRGQPGRLALHLPAGWPWAVGWTAALARFRALPLLARPTGPPPAARGAGARPGAASRAIRSAPSAAKSRPRPAPRLLARPPVVETAVVDSG